MRHWWRNLAGINTTNRVPRSWSFVTIDEMIGKDGLFRDGDWVESKDQDPNGEIRLIQLADIGDGDFKDKSSRFLTREKALELKCTFLKPDDILVARMPDPLGRTCIFPIKGKEAHVTVVDVCIIRVGEQAVSQKYLSYLINSPISRKEIESHKTGSTRKRISRKNFGKIKFPVAPLEEQQRIVSKLEELLSELDKGIESFKTAREQLIVYRQAVLKHAFEGKLTEEWRKKHADELEPAETLLEKIKAERAQRYRQQLDDWKRAVNAWKASDKKGKKPKNPSKPKARPPLTEEELSELPELPEGWSWSYFEYCGDWCGGGTPSKTKPEYWEGGSVLWISPKDMKTKYIYETIDNITPLGVESSSAKYINPDSVLFVVRSGILRRVLPIGITTVQSTVNQDLQAFTPIQIIPEYIYWFSSGHEYDLRKECAKDGTTVESIESTLLKRYKFPVCSVIEQREIVQQIESRLSVAERLKQEIEDGLKQAEALRQSLLKKAFEGRLVPQDPNDEPASVLLARIKTEKAKLKKNARKEKKVAV